MKQQSLSRVSTCILALMLAVIAAPFTARASHVQTDTSDRLAYSYPIGMPSEPLGVGFYVRHGYAVENTWYRPGYWHTGEDWYALDGNSAGANVYAAADGEVVFAGSDYPGRVVIVAHEDGLFSMYGHLDYALNVTEGDRVERGDLLGTVLARSDDVPSHLHFEVRTFLTTPEVNGENPRYGFQCGRNCLPGPGYWPIDAPEHPSAMGWLNPTHVINSRTFDEATSEPLGEVVVAPEPLITVAEVWSGPEGDDDARQTGALTLSPGTTYPLLAINTGAEDSTETSAEAYDVWYEIRISDDRSGWVRTTVPWDFETGSDGRPSSVRFQLLLDVDAG
ncbi:MAG TPA: M23 family metallopeptidase [Thermomicrobiales bacterium]|nr:M23 family metallopeptidase [Thermomicrobiales bacterium]